jgi:drug/metabolite transporter (DMT)-like permease
MSDAREARTIGLLLVLGAASCFALIGTTVKAALDIGGSALGLTALRFVIATVIATLVSSPRRVLALIRSRRGRPLIVAGITGGAIVGSAEYAAYGHMPVAIVVFTLWLAPTWIGIWEWVVLRKRPAKLMVASLGFQIVGLYLLVGVDLRAVSAWGLFLALIGSSGTAFLFLLIQRSADLAESAFAAVAVLCISAAVVSLPVAVMFGDLPRHVSDPRLLGLTVLLGVVPTMTGFILLFEGLRRAPALDGALVASTGPFMAAGVAWVVHDESLAAIQVLGGALIVASAFMISRRHGEHTRAGTYGFGSEQPPATPRLSGG